jgi:plastocyanin
MRKMLMTTVAAAVLLGGSSAIARTDGIEITKSGFDAGSITIDSGDSVSWKNSDTVAHEVTIDGTTCKLSLEPGQSSSCTFANAGTFTYKDPTMQGNAFQGKLTVIQNTRSVSLSSNRARVILGDAVTLSGTVSSKRAGETVTIVAKGSGQPTTSTEVTTTTGGNWTLQVQPQANTTFQAQFEGATSGSSVVSIRPRITLEKVGLDRFLAVVIAAKSMAGKTVELTRLESGRWVSIGQQPLQSIARTNTTVVATFTSGVPDRTKLRIFMPTAQTSPDYLDGHSNFVVK